MRKTLFAIALLTLASLVFAKTKAYDVNILSPSKASNVALATGKYSLSLDGDKAVFKGAKTVTVPVKVENGAGKKFENTSMETVQKDGVEEIKLIHLAGTTTTLQFGL